MQCRAPQAQLHYLQPPVGLASELPSFGKPATLVTQVGHACSAQGGSRKKRSRKTSKRCAPHLFCIPKNATPPLLSTRHTWQTSRTHAAARQRTRACTHLFHRKQCIVIIEVVERGIHYHGICKAAGYIYGALQVMSNLRADGQCAQSPDMLVADAWQKDPSGYARLAAMMKNGSGSMPAMRISVYFHKSPIM